MATFESLDGEIEPVQPTRSSAQGQAVIAVGERNGADFIELSGVWSLRTLGQVWPQIAKLTDEFASTGKRVEVDATEITQFDVSGAWAVREIAYRLEARGRSVNLVASDRLEAVFQRMSEQNRDYSFKPPENEEDAVVGALASLGQKVAQGISDFIRGLDLAGALMLWIVTAARRGGLRPRSIATHGIRMGIGAVPVVAISAFLVGGVIAQQSAYQLKDFGAETLAVDLSSYMIFRELAILIAAIMVAGRSASAIAAEIGAMKMREEVDALTVMGLEPVEVLVIPRLVALVLVLPLLTIVAMGFAIFGAATLVNLYSGIGFELYLERMRDFVWPSTIISTMIKTPFMAIAIGVIGCLEGLKVGGSTESLGQRTTSAVVKSIFAVFLLNGFFAVFFAAIEYG
ncbi:MAG: ABC transporter permease [Pseudomonadota bacterium]